MGKYFKLLIFIAKVFYFEAWILRASIFLPLEIINTKSIDDKF